MEKYTYGRVTLTGSQKRVDRVIYTDGSKYYIKWYGTMIEVNNVYGIGKVTAGWRTVEQY